VSTLNWPLAELAAGASGDPPSAALLDEHPASASVAASAAAGSAAARLERGTDFNTGMPFLGGKAGA
jgi:hypothetical protein